MKHKCYIASGWFNEKQARDLATIKEVLDFNDVRYFSPKDECLAKPSEGLKSQKKIFKGNIDAIKKARFIIANTRDKDMGTIFECGVAYSFNVPIIYYCEGLEGNFNLMLSQSGCSVAASPNILDEHIKGIMKSRKYKKEYKGTIE